MKRAAEERAFSTFAEDPQKGQMEDEETYSAYHCR